MEKVESLLSIYEQLQNCTNPNEVEKLRESLNKSNIRVKGSENERDQDLCKKGGSKNFGARNMRSRMLLVAEKSREVGSLIKEAKQLAEKGQFRVDLTIEVDEELQVNFPTSHLVGKSFSTDMHKIIHLLTNNKAFTIGVWGMGGVGKTTLVKHLHNMMLTRPEIYGFVYWITVSKDCSIQKLQNDIANRIGETISDKVDDSQRAGIIVEALKRKKKLVLILDDMWSDYDLNEVGLGFPKEIGYRLIVTSRSKDVCLKMNCDEIIEVNPLSQKDAWTLFIKSIGHKIPDNLTKISTDVLQECSGLPLGIITLAKSMIGCNDIYQWRNVLNELRNPTGRIDDMEEKLFKVLKLSYERLKDDEIKKCLLYCAIYPEDYPIGMNELVWMFIDAGLLGKNVELTKMFDKSLAILKKLESLALLSIETVQPVLVEEKVVVLHDLIRDMALQIAGSRFMIKAGNRLEGIPNEESWTDELEVVSLMENHIKEITNFSPRCTKPSILLLQRNSIGFVSDCFFKYLYGLKHLDLSSTRIITLPKSISLLKNLTSLILMHCIYLETLPSLAKLTSLERLNIWRTSISQLPKGIEKLIRLRYLNLYFTRIERISAGVISKLTALQYLAIKATFDVEELKSLNQLQHLTIFFEDFDRFSKFSTYMKIKGRPDSYNFIFGVDLRYHNEDIMRNWWSEKQIFLTMSLRDKLKMKPFNDASGRGRESSNLWERPEMKRTLELICEDVNTLCIECEADLIGLGDFVLDSAQNLEQRFGIKRVPQPFFNLETLILKRCSNTKYLFPLGLLKNLQNMKAIRIWCCRGLEALIEEADDENKVGGIGPPQKFSGPPQKFSLPKLKQLHLNDLPNLHSLYSNGKVIHTPSLQCISIKGCPKLKRMPFDVDNQHQPFPQMKYCKSDEKWIQSLEWDPPESKSKIAFMPSEMRLMSFW